jgi:DNA-binding Lrp family transcriptional regulator
MAHIIKKGKDGKIYLVCKESSPEQLKTISSSLAQKIAKELSEKERYPKELAKKLNIHEQKVYYHIKKLEKAGILKKSKTENISGVIANYYALAYPAFALTFKEFEPCKKEYYEQEENPFLSPFIENGELNTLIVQGSPITHGAHHHRSRDIKQTTSLILFLGTYFTKIPNYKCIKTDLEMTKENLKENIILIGGPIANTIVKKIKKYLPLKFTPKGIYSSCSKKIYSHDETGAIIKIQSPFNKSKSILVLAGNTYLGTISCIIALFKRFDEISAGNRYQPRVHAKIVEGINIESENEAEDVKILE